MLFIIFILYPCSDADGVLFDEETAVKNNGMEYRHISVSSVASIDIPLLNTVSHFKNICFHTVF